MAFEAGHDGMLKIGGVDASLDAWTINFINAIQETSKFGNKWQTFANGIRGATGTISGTLDRANTGQASIITLFATTAAVTDVTLSLYHSATTGYSCTAVITSLAVGASVGTKQAFSAGWTLDGDIGTT